MIEFEETKIKRTLIWKFLNFDTLNIKRNLKHLISRALNFQSKCKFLSRQCYKNYMRKVESSIVKTPKYFWKHVDERRKSLTIPNSMYLGDVNVEDDVYSESVYFFL